MLSSFIFPFPTVLLLILGPWLWRCYSSLQPPGSANIAVTHSCSLSSVQVTSRGWRGWLQLQGSHHLRGSSLQRIPRSTTTFPSAHFLLTLLPLVCHRAPVLTSTPTLLALSATRFSALRLLHCCTFTSLHLRPMASRSL